MFKWASLKSPAILKKIWYSEQYWASLRWLFVTFCFRCTIGRMTMKSTRSVLGLSLIHLLDCSLIHLFRTTRFARALCCAHSLTRYRRGGRPVEYSLQRESVRPSVHPYYADAYTAIVIYGSFNLSLCVISSIISILNMTAGQNRSTPKSVGVLD